MSQTHARSPRHCGNKQSIKLHKFNKKIFIYLSSLLLPLLTLIFLVWLILHPKKPRFSLDQAVVNQLDLSGPPPLLNSSIQLTLRSDNPNTKVGIHYDELLLHASYEGEKITSETSVPPFYQEHGETNSISVSLVGIQQPVGPSFSYEIRRDEGIGELVFGFKVNGRLRWRVGSWVSGRYRFAVDCASVMPFGRIGPITSTLLSSRQGSQCSTTL
ncbi:hypothetical protein OROGR_010948 [Orobanche gracilis]